MCGVIALINKFDRSVERGLLKNLVDSIGHRGPDGQGLEFHKNIGLGHSRLAILDLHHRSDQPLTSSDGLYTIIYNGEIYNYKDLKQELVILGHTFFTESDTEVVLNAYIEWGADSLNKFNGMFAFVVLDRREDILFIARDRYGIKPLYYIENDKVLMFASEQKPIMLHPDIPKKIDFEALYEYFCFQNILSDKTFVKGIKTFPPGSYALYSIGNKNFSVRRYWDFNFQSDYSISREDATKEISRLFKDSVKRQAVSDVQVGSYLSSGIDSTSIVSHAIQEIPNLKTFTCGYNCIEVSEQEKLYDEREIAARTAQFFKREHYSTLIDYKDMTSILPRLAFSLEEPRVGQSYPNYYAAELAAQHVKVVFSGAGADELLGGYPWRYKSIMQSQDEQEFYNKQLAQGMRIAPVEKIDALFLPVRSELSQVNRSRFIPSVFKDLNVSSIDFSNQGEVVNLSLYYDAKTFLHGLLVIEDKINMANSIESRVPFLDNDFVDFVSRIPAEYKVPELFQGRGSVKSNVYTKGKHIFRQAMRGNIPLEIYEGRKQGFSAPDATWFQEDANGFIKDTLLRKDASVTNFLDKELISTVIKEHDSVKQNNRAFIWSLLAVEFYFKSFIA